MEMHFADVWEAVAAAVPAMTAVVQGERHLTWHDYEGRAARLAAVLREAGVTAGASVGMYLFNSPEYLETQFAALKRRAQPINVNYRYLDDELVYLLDNADVVALVYGANFAERVDRIRTRLPGLQTLIEVDDGGQTGGIEDALSYEAALAAADPDPPTARSPEDLYMLYTGGTTGLPKGVVYRVGDLTSSFLLATSQQYRFAPATAPEHGPAIAERLAEEGATLSTLAAPPLMHGAGVWLGAMAPHLLGSAVVLLQNRSFDPVEAIAAVERERVGTIVVVGDAFARPLLDVLEQRPLHERPLLPSLRFVASSGAMLSARSKERILAVAPHVTILDVLGASEGRMGVAVANRDRSPSTASFRLNPGVRVIREDGTDVEPGSGEIGMVAATSLMTPVAYHKDPEKSARTFREIDGVRYSIPGDMALVEANGSITLLGRGSNCINTGGEKVFPEEVEEAIKTHPSVLDCLVFGTDDERFGQRVVGIVSVADSVAVDDITQHTRQRLADHKVPRELQVVAVVPRMPSGKADYSTARDLFHTSEETT